MLCAHFGVCGGCRWQHLSYAEQLLQKQQVVQTELEKLNFQNNTALKSIFSAIIPAQQTTYYRNKLEFSFGTKWLSAEEMQDKKVRVDRRALGFYVGGRFDRLVDVAHCYLQADPSNEIRNALRAFAIEQKLGFYHFKTHQGLLRNLIIRTAENQVMVVVVFCALSSEEEIQMHKVLDFLTQRFYPITITTLLYVNNTKKNDNITDLTVTPYKGNPVLIEKMLHPSGKTLHFQVSAQSFYQTNSVQAQKLYEIVHDFAQIQPNDIVYDLYTGTGTIALFLAYDAKKVVGVEYVQSAVDNAHKNAQMNQIENVYFFAGDLKNVLNTDFVDYNGKPNIIVVDPPRAGMDAKVVDQLLQILPQKIVYVSCNVLTQTRDVALLQDKYQIIKIQPIDLFPRTPHVENVLLLTLRN